MVVSMVTGDVLRMGCGASVVIDEARMTAVVFGANGMVGGAVAKILVNHPRFTVKAITRKPTSDVVRQLAEDGQSAILLNKHKAAYTYIHTYTG